MEDNDFFFKEDSKIMQRVKPLAPADGYIALVLRWSSLVNELKMLSKNNPEEMEDEGIHIGQLSSLYFCINELKSLIEYKAI